ncbi:MAG: sensor histidine kinase [Lachnospiraceae bacterium]|nr:sensor histidine kinase [Lachnospiraceae bacterium]
MSLRSILAYRLQNTDSIKRRSLQWTISLSYTAISIISILAMAIAFYTHSINTIRDNNIKENQQIVDQVSWNLNSYIRSMMGISDTMYYNVIKNTDLTYEKINKEMNLLYEANKDNLTGIVLVTEDGAIVAASPVSTRKPGVDLKKQEWFSRAHDEIENIHFSTPHVQNIFDNSSYRYFWVVSLSRSVELTFMGNIRNGILLVDMNYSGIEQMFEKVNDGGVGFVYLCDSDGKIIYHPMQKAIYADLIRENNLEHAKHADGAFSEVFDGRERDIVIKTVGYTGWKIVSVTPVSELAMGMGQMRNYLIVVAIIMLILIVFGNNIISYVVTDPIRRLEKSIAELEEGALNLNKAAMNEDDIYIGGSHEIRHLGRTIKSMVRQMKKLTDDMIHETEAKRKSELDALQSQINPHFLYNTLDSVVWMIEGERYEDAIRMVTALAQLFRISLSKGNNIITIHDEIIHAKNYLNIQMVRFKNRFTADIDIDPAIEDCATIKLIVQPLLENAIYYGVEHMVGEGEIKIRGVERDGDIYLSVSDNGMGIPEETLATLLTDKARSRGKGSGIGLWNVNQRIQIYFKGDYGLMIESELDVGTTVTIHLPKISIEEYRREETKAGQEDGHEKDV